MESTPYLLPNTQGRYVTVKVTETSGEVYRINDDGTRTIYADYFVENGNTVIVASGFSSPEFQRNIADGSQGYRQTIGNSIIQTTGAAPPGQPTPPSSPEQGGSSPINPATPGTPQQPEKAYLRYPLDMKDSQDRIMFQAYEYQSGLNRLPGTSSGSFGQLNPVQYVNPKQPVILPIQSSIIDQNSVGWESDTMNPIEIAAANLSKGLMGANTPTDIGTTVAAKFTEALVESKKYGNAIRAYLIGQAIGVNNLQSRLLGQVLNPNLELLFQGPQLRPFNFTFKMSARNKNEAVEIKKIIKYFKKNMAVRGGDGENAGTFLRAPNVFKIQYQLGTGNPHPGINLIKMCALTNCSIDYTPLGSYTTYNDGTMVAYSMSLSFQELTPIYDTDYDKQFDYGETPASPVPVTYYTENNGIGP